MMPFVVIAAASHDIWIGRSATRNQILHAKDILPANPHAGSSGTIISLHSSITLSKTVARARYLPRERA